MQIPTVLTHVISNKPLTLQTFNTLPDIKKSAAPSSGHPSDHTYRVENYRSEMFALCYALQIKVHALISLNVLQNFPTKLMILATWGKAILQTLSLRHFQRLRSTERGKSG